MLSEELNDSINVRASKYKVTNKVMIKILHTTEGLTYELAFVSGFSAY